MKRQKLLSLIGLILLLATMLMGCSVYGDIGVVNDQSSLAEKDDFRSSVYARI